MANHMDDLLVLFADNDTHDITAERLRQFVTDIYTDALLDDDIVDDLVSDQATDKPLSASRGAWLQTQINTINSRLDALEAAVSALQNP